MIGDLSKERERAFKKFREKYYRGVENVRDPKQVFCCHWVSLAFQHYYKNEYFQGGDKPEKD